MSELKAGLKNTQFGEQVDLPIPSDTNVVIVCINRGYGLIPMKVSLPHQLYWQEITDWIQEYPNIKEVTAIPAKSSEYITVWSKWK